MDSITPKRIEDSAVHEHTYKVFPNDLNSYGTVFGGLIMSILDRIALVVAERHSGETCVTASVDSVHFLAPAHKGDVLLFKAAVNRSWKSSMEIGVKVLAESPKDKTVTHIASAYLTFVAIGKDLRPVEVAHVVPESAMEKRRFEEADRRRSRRKEEAAEIKKRRHEGNW
jgi:acyl-CoA hydrolase